MALLRANRLLSLLLISLTALWGTAPVTVSGQYTSYNFGLDTNRRMAIRQAQTTGTPRPHVVRGRGNGESLVLRLEIRELEQDKDMWMMYILGLNRLQYTNQSDPTSWYGITGIHGIPHKTWSGVGPTPGNEETGYCTHSSILFPTWHRPYLVLYEQVLYDAMMEIAAMWPTAQEQQYYQSVVARFRIPYWDWASEPPSGQSVLPLSVGGNPTIDVNGPFGVQRITNPLYSYWFKPLNATAFIQDPWDIWTRTVRSPTTNDTTTLSNNTLVALNLDINADSLRQRLFILLAKYGNYSDFSNNAWIPVQNRDSYDSLESLHDTVHNLAGGGGFGQPNMQGGHMAYIPYSAFDPIFFLHHCNVDRIFAIWQSIFPNSWVTPSPAVLPSYTTSKGQIQDRNTALTPFFASDDGTFWTSDSIRDHTVFGYTYPDFTGGSAGGNVVNASSTMASRTQTAARVKKAINRLYGKSSPSGLFIKAMEARRKQLHSGQGHARDQPSSLISERDAKPRKGVVFFGNRYREWIVNVYVSKQALNGPFAINFFLGSDKSISPDPADWPFAPNHVGTMGIFAAPPMKRTGAGAGYGMASGGGTDMHNLDISGTVPLTMKLVDKVVMGELDSLQPGDVERYLRENLKRRILTADGRVVDREEELRLGGGNFGVMVVSAEVEAAETDEELPVWGKVDVEIDMS